jgi:putative Mn2+ efflux pump MntP
MKIKFIRFDVALINFIFGLFLGVCISNQFIFNTPETFTLLILIGIPCIISFFIINTTKESK